MHQFGGDPIAKRARKELKADVRLNLRIEAKGSFPQPRHILIETYLFKGLSSVPFGQGNGSLQIPGLILNLMS